MTFKLIYINRIWECGKDDQAEATIRWGRR